MSSQNLEKIIASGIKDAVIRHYYPWNLKISTWKPVLDKILEIFSGTEKDIEEKLKNHSLRLSEPNMRMITLFLINSFLPDSEIWRDIIEIKSKRVETPYSAQTYYKFVLIPKEEALKKCSPLWVYKNYDEVKEFMKDDNELYKRLNSLEKIIIEEDD